MSEIYSQNYWKKKHTPAGEKGLEPRDPAYYKVYGVYQSLTARPNGGGLNTPVFGDLARARFIPLLPCNVLRGWCRMEVTAPPPTTFSMILYIWNGGADQIIVQTVVPDQPMGHYFMQLPTAGHPLSVIDPALGQGFFMLLSVTNTTIYECGIDYKLSERILMP